MYNIVRSRGVERHYRATGTNLQIVRNSPAKFWYACKYGGLLLEPLQQTVCVAHPKVHKHKHAKGSRGISPKKIIYLDM